MQMQFSCRQLLPFLFLPQLLLLFLDSEDKIPLPTKDTPKKLYFTRPDNLKKVLVASWRQLDNLHICRARVPQ